LLSEGGKFQIALLKVVVNVTTVTYKVAPMHDEHNFAANIQYKESYYYYNNYYYYYYTKHAHCAQKL